VSSLFIAWPPVVVAATVVRSLDEGVAAGLEVVAIIDHALADAGVVDHPVQSVRAEHVQIADLWLLVRDVDLHGLLHAEGPDDHVLVREVLDLLFREILHLDVVVEQRVIFGHLLHLIAAQSVDAAVAYVTQECAVPCEREANEPSRFSSYLRPFSIL
jgi:hypothetical protein